MPPSNTRSAELLEAAAAFHHAICDEPKPEWIDRRTNRWRVADRIAWGDESADDLLHRRHLAPLVAARRPVHLRSQLIHADLAGNVLFEEGQPPAIIDLSLYWRPVGYSAAILVSDALTWDGASRAYDRIVDLVLSLVDRE